MAQLVPMLLLGLVWRRLTLAGALSGLVAGVALVCVLVFSGHDPVVGDERGDRRARREPGGGARGDLAGAAEADGRPDAEVLARDDEDGDRREREDGCRRFAVRGRQAHPGTTGG